jgi:hypothetical protein
MKSMSEIVEVGHTRELLISLRHHLGKQTGAINERRLTCCPMGGSVEQSALKQETGILTMAVSVRAELTISSDDGPDLVG